MIIEGTCDVYDRMTATVIDWKTTSRSKLITYRSKGPTWQQIVQVSLYGHGWRRLGLPVDQVMIIFLPRDGELHESHIWHAPFDDQIALDALTRLAGIKQLVDSFDVAALDMLPTADAFCLHCPYLKFNSSRLVEGCPGDPATLQPTQTVPRLEK